jgi:hypothetical protein
MFSRHDYLASRLPGKFRYRGSNHLWLCHWLVDILGHPGADVAR